MSANKMTLDRITSYVMTRRRVSDRMTIQNDFRVTRQNDLRYNG
jgi:hypothetical protein